MQNTWQQILYNLIIIIIVVFELSLVKHDKMSLPKNNCKCYVDPFCDVMKGPVCEW